MITTQLIFDNYFLGDLYKMMKAHESEIIEIAEESKISLGGPLALVSKVQLLFYQVRITRLKIWKKDENKI